MTESATNSQARANLPRLDLIVNNSADRRRKKKVVRKKGNDDITGDTVVTGSKTPKALPRKSAAKSSASGEEASKSKRKKRKYRQKDERERDAASARRGVGQVEDVASSKLSLAKSSKDGSPRKKIRKKVKKTYEKAENDPVFDTTLTADLSNIKDDIVSVDTKRDKEKEECSMQPYYMPLLQLRSQPTENIYIETVGGFRVENKRKFMKRQATRAKAVIQKSPTNTALEFALSTHKVLHTFVLFCHGILAGLSAWHAVISYVLLQVGDANFIEHYRGLVLPVQCTFYILIVMCAVSAMDRFDIGFPTRGCILKAMTLRNGAVSVVLYISALVITLFNGTVEDKIHLYNLKPELWNNTLITAEDLFMWQHLNTTRNGLCVLGWLVISLAPYYDRLAYNLCKSYDKELISSGKQAFV